MLGSLEPISKWSRETWLTAAQVASLRGQPAGEAETRLHLNALREMLHVALQQPELFHLRVHGKRDKLTIGTLELELAICRSELRFSRGDRKDDSWWTCPPKDPVAFTATLRAVFAGKRRDPTAWPWSDDSIINCGFFLSEKREEHFVTKELLEAGEGLIDMHKVMLSMALRYTQSLRGASLRYRDAIQKSVLPEAIVLPQRRDGFAPYRNVMRRTELAQAIQRVSMDAVHHLPFPSIVAARDWFKVRLVADSTLGLRRTSFCGCEVAKDLALWGFVVFAPNMAVPNQGVRSTTLPPLHCIALVQRHILDVSALVGSCERLLGASERAWVCLGASRDPLRQPKQWRNLGNRSKRYRHLDKLFKLFIHHSSRKHYFHRCINLHPINRGIHCGKFKQRRDIGGGSDQYWNDDKLFQ